MIALITTYAAVWLILGVYVASLSCAERRLRQGSAAGQEGMDGDA